MFGSFKGLRISPRRRIPIPRIYNNSVDIDEAVLFPGFQFIPVMLRSKHCASALDAIHKIRLLFYSFFISRVTFPAAILELVGGEFDLRKDYAEQKERKRDETERRSNIGGCPPICALIQLAPAQ